ncbi:hypothetical protein ABEX25_12785 [Paenibacillus thiaminolyticus]|uniref:hypothetical protein n=1 Tax=Paenibacillus thiaminolyticus TaxID=49283 RepID=UPI003D2C6C83
MIVNRNRRAGIVAVTALLLALLQGCMYPKELRMENQQSAREGVLLVQSAMDEYWKDTGLLPIQNSEVDVPRYEKFRVDFEALKHSGKLSATPASAFEAGGSGSYLIIDEETEPKVRIMDLAVAQYVNDAARAVDSYKRKQGRLPSKEEAYPGFYRIDEAAAGLKPSGVRNPFSGEPLALMMDEQGRVYADYAVELMQVIEAGDKPPAEDGADLRPLLTEKSFYVPVKSVPYIWKDGAPWPQAATES